MLYSVVEVILRLVIADVKPSRRQLQAEATRRDIVDSARHLFASNGYSTSTITQIAQHAGVAVQTVYKAFGTKQAILLALLDTLEADARHHSNVHRFGATNEPVEDLRQLVAFHRALFDASRDGLSILRGAAYGDLGTILEEGGRRRRHGQSRLIAQWSRGKHLRPGLSTRRAADITWALTGPELYSLLVLQSGWNSATYEQWLIETLHRQLFNPDTTTPTGIRSKPDIEASRA